jgi:hypothetical protein
MTDADRIIEEAKKEMLPFESWERLKGEGSEAYCAFCVFRDFGADRNIRKAICSVEKDELILNKRYRVWRNYSSKFRWNERAADYERYIENLKQTEYRKTIEAQAEKHRLVTGKMLDVVNKKLDLMNPEDLTQNTLTEWVQVAVKVEREAANSVLGLVSPNGKQEPKQGELNFLTDFQGL